MPDCPQWPRFSHLAGALPAIHPLWATDSGIQAICSGSSQRNNNDGDDKREKLLEVLGLFKAQIVVMVSQMYTYLHAHQGVHIRFVQLSYANHTSKVKK